MIGIHRIERAAPCRGLERRHLVGAVGSGRAATCKFQHLALEPQQSLVEGAARKVVAVECRGDLGLAPCVCRQLHESPHLERGGTCVLRCDATLSRLQRILQRTQWRHLVARDGRLERSESEGRDHVPHVARAAEDHKGVARKDRLEDLLGEKGRVVVTVAGDRRLEHDAEARARVQVGRRKRGVLWDVLATALAAQVEVEPLREEPAELGPALLVLLEPWLWLALRPQGGLDLLFAGALARGRQAPERMSKQPLAVQRLDYVLSAVVRVPTEQEEGGGRRGARRRGRVSTRRAEVAAALVGKLSPSVPG
eukprot:2260015-Prymnesium_polylepis.1